MTNPAPDPLMLKTANRIAPMAAEDSPKRDGKHSRRNPRLPYELKIVLLALAAGFPAVLTSMILLWLTDYTSKVQWTLSIVILGVWLGLSFGLRSRVVVPLQTIANLLSALREGDFSIRARGADQNDALGSVVAEINELGEILHKQRLGALEATALLRKVMEEIDVSVFAFDHNSQVRLVNKAGEKLLARAAERIIGHTAAELGLEDILQGEQSRLVESSFAGGAGRFELRRTTFRLDGLPHHLLVLSDLSRALREEERSAWKRLIRVIGHELNNSLTPIKSIAASLERLISKDPLPPDWREDIARGLGVIGNRGEALGRFMQGYARLARLPAPQRQPIEVGAWVRRVVRLETRMEILLIPGPELTIQADGDQLDQLLINLQRNAVDAVLPTGGAVRVGWAKTPSHFEIWVDDEGPGLPNTANLFVPFFTTKPNGSGIGLVLSREIAEGHGGMLILKNKPDSPGCLALLRLPL